MKFLFTKDLKTASFNGSITSEIVTVLEKHTKEDFIENMGSLFALKTYQNFSSCQIGAISTIAKYLGASKNLAAEF